MAKDPGLAVVISLLFPGLGQVYTEQFFWAVFFFFAFIVSAILIAGGIGLILLPIVYFAAAWHAYRGAK